MQQLSYGYADYLTQTALGDRKRREVAKRKKLSLL
jgi:hypothetical protein